jgi:putative methanogenesis marker protein 8
VEFRIRDFGIFTENRQMRMKDFLSFGISEVMAMCVSNGILDCAVTVCDGSGTVVVDDPELVQGIGGRISGLVETSPIQNIIKEIGPDRVLDPETARIDQVAGARKAWGMGYRRIGVTVVKAEEAALIRKEFGDNVVLFGVHTTGISEADARVLLDHCDVVTACASKFIWKWGKEMEAMQVGRKVPIFATSGLGRQICKMRLQQIDKQAKSGPDEPAVPLL